MKHSDLLTDMRDVTLDQEQGPHFVVSMATFEVKLVMELSPEKSSFQLLHCSSKCSQHQRETEIPVSDR